MEKIISYPISIVYYSLFIFFLIFFHPIQWICFNVFGYQAHKKSVDYLNFCLVGCMRILGTTFSFINKENIPKNKPIIFVANHQSMYDIITMIWFLRRFHAKFVSKKELGKGVPSVSYNLRVGGSVLIDRKDPKQAISAIGGLSKYIETYHRSAVIFPEGTRSKTGEPKKFSESGLKMLCKYAPSAIIVPITINNSWKMVKFGSFPMGLTNKLEFIFHESIPVNQFSFEEIMLKTENAVVHSIKK
jgi:1-acyl-sn-glycerol-3-phosphate acyltransferase